MKNKQLYQEKALKVIKDSLSHGQLSLFVGAGVSQSPVSGVPGWGGLASRVLELAWPKDKFDPVKEVLNNKGPLKSMRLARLRLKEEFPVAVQTALYEKDPQPTEAGKAIARLQGIKEICCFNFDDMLESAFASTSRRCKSVEPCQKIPKDGDVLIYHPHGYIPRTAEPEELRSKKPEQAIIFSEDDYHLFYGKPYSWATLIQLKLLLSTDVLFVGFSLRDPNTLRLLDLIKEMGIPQQRMALLPDPKAGSVKIPPDEAELLIATEIALIESSGVIPYFYDRHEDVPKILDSLKS